MRPRRPAAIVLLAGLAWAGASPAQAPGAAWDVRASEAVDLWYYGLAAVRYAGPGTTPYYSADFARSVRDAMRAGGGAPSRLEAEASALGAALGRDPVFESLHFLPLHLRGNGQQLIASVRSIVAGAGGSARPGDREGSAIRAFAAVIATPARRASLGRFVDALDEVRPAFVRLRARDDVRRSAELGALAERWSRDFVPALAPYLATIGVRGGAIIVSPALGAEGRIVREAETVVIAVGAGAAESPDAPLFAAVRELCFPLIEDLVTPGTQARAAAIDLASRAAVRCGAMLLDAAAAPVADGYRRHYLGRPAARQALLHEFDARFPLAPALEQSLRGKVDRATSGARATGRLTPNGVEPGSFTWEDQ